jgi:phosphoglycerol transferase MdoB-like AlkP superfamily enzyme
MNEYDGPEAFDGNWGIYDEEFLNFYAKKLNSFPQPFMSGIFTLSSHHPYSIPDKHKNLFPASESKLQRTIRYTDYSLGEFFNEIKNMPWYKHTLFIITADHTARDEQSNDDNSVTMYRIPIVFYHPGDNSLKGRSTKIVQQTDIMPSVYQYLGVNTPFLAFGQSVFAQDSTWAVYYLGGIYKFITGNYALSFDGEKSLFLEDISFNAKGNINLLDAQPDMASRMETQLKAVIQQYYTRLTQNRMVNKLAK